MLDKLLDKSAGRRPFPLVHGDGAALPFRTSSFGGAVVRHVLHLVPAYEEVVEELLRVVRPGGVIVASAGWWSPISDELDELLSERERVGWAAGLDARDVPTQDRAFEARGAVARAKPPIRAPDPDTAGGYADAIEKDLFSWTWRLPEEDRLRAAEKVRRWATARGLGLDDPMDTELESRWRAYDIPG